MRRLHDGRLETGRRLDNCKSSCQFSHYLLRIRGCRRHSTDHVKLNDALRRHRTLLALLLLAIKLCLFQLVYERFSCTLHLTHDESIGIIRGQLIDSDVCEYLNNNIHVVLIGRE